MMERIGKVAYRLKLPEGSRIHDVFHISQMKKAVGNHEVISALPPVCFTEACDPVLPSEVLAKWYNVHGEMELLVTWKGKTQGDDSWLLESKFMSSFPSFEFQGKLGFEGEVLIGI